MKRVDTTVNGSEFEWDMNPRNLAEGYLKGVSCLARTELAWGPFSSDPAFVQPPPIWWPSA